MEFSLIYASELDREIQQKRAMLIDIRGPEDYKKKHWRGAVNVPFEEIEQKRVRLPRQRYLIFYCEHGGSSMELARQLGKEGYRVATVVGGMESMKKFL